MQCISKSSADLVKKRLAFVIFRKYFSSVSTISNLGQRHMSYVNYELDCKLYVIL
jgi:transposase